MSAHHRKHFRGKVAHHLRMQTFHRADYQCQACGARGKRLECDHIVPLEDGGASTLDNLQALCRDCHLAKSRREAGCIEGLNEWSAFVNRSDWKRRHALR